MAVNNATGYNRTTNEPLDALYLNSGSVYASTTEVNSKVNITVRYTGSMFNVNGELYWYKDGVQDSDLVLFRVASASYAATASGADRFEIRDTPNATVNTDKFLVSDSGSIKYRTGAEVLSDINAQPSGSYITSLTGEVTASGPGAASATLLNSAVTGKVLTGLNLVGGGTISATDSILQAFGKVQNQISAMVGGVIYQGVWNASTNSPTITSSTGTKGHYYVVNVAGSTNIDGITDWKVGDWIIFNGTTWDKVDNTDAVSSVNGFTGAVSLTTANIPEVTNLYYTDARVLSYGNTQYVRLDGSYSNPAWITALAWSKITGTPTTLAGYGITDAYTQTQINNFFAGTTAITGYNKSNWDTAFGWGNHAGLYVLKTGDTMSGNLGIGQASALQSGGTGITIYGATASEIKFLNSTTGQTTTDGTALVQSGLVFNINNRELGEVRLGTNNTTRVTIGSDGNTVFTNNITAANIIRSGGTSAQFLKADGSVDSNTYATTGALSGYLPLSGGTLSGSLSGTNFAVGARSTSNAFQLPDWRIYNTAGGNLAFNDFTADRVTLSSSTLSLGVALNGTSLSMSGEALIGGAVTDGTNKLIVNGGVKATGLLTITNDNARNELLFDGNDFTNIYSTTTSGIQFGISNAASTGALEFLTANAVRLTIASTGAATFSSSVTAAGSGGRTVKLLGGGNGTVEIAGDGSTYATAVLFRNTDGGTVNAGLFNYGTGGVHQWLAIGGTTYTNAPLNLTSTNVGINTTSPNRLLELASGSGSVLGLSNSTSGGGSGILYGRLAMYSTAFSNAYIDYGGEIRSYSGAGVDYSDLRFYTANASTSAERMRLTSNGILLLGIPSSLGAGANTNPLQVYGGVTIAATSGVYTYATMQYSGLDFVITGNAHPANLGVNSIIFRTGSSGGGSPFEVMRLNSNGQVGIGTDSPLGVFNTYKTPTASTFTTHITVGGLANYRSLEIGVFDMYDAFISTFGNDLRILAGKDLISENRNIRFYTTFVGATIGAQNYERMRIGHNGDVTLFTLAGAGNRIAYFDSGGTFRSMVIGSGLSFDGTTLSATGGASGTVTGSGTSGTIPLWNSVSDIGNSVMTQSSGNITTSGIFTANGAIRTKHQFTIENSVGAVSGYLIPEYRWLGSGSSADVVIGAEAGNGFGVYVNGNITKVLSIATTGIATFSSSVTAGGDIYLGTRSVWLSSWLNQSVQTGANVTFNQVTATNGGFNSDLSLKNVIGLGTLLNIADDTHVIRFTWKDPTKGTSMRYGYGAQYIQALIPEAVYKANDGTLAVDYTQVHTVLIDENTRRIKALEARVKELEEQINQR